MRLALLITLLVAASLHAQSRGPAQPNPGGPTFDVVSIRHAPDSPLLNNRTERPGGGYILEKGSIAVLIAEAYGILSTDIVGLPRWAETEAYDVMATGSLARPTRDQRRAMKRALLAERFRLRAHDETREREAYDLVEARDDGRLGAGLVPHDVDCVAQALAAQDAAANGEPPPEAVASSTPCGLRVTRTGLGGQMPMFLLADLLRSVVGRVVVDKTGLQGSYRVTLSFDQPATVRADAPPSDTLPSIFDALPDQLGLKLEPSRAQVRVLVVDSIDRPTPN